MTNRFNNVSMIGKLAYVNMCVEKYLVNMYPDRDWSPISEILWKATSMNWADWTELYSCYIPDVILQYPSYDSDDLGDCITEDSYYLILSLFSGITSGEENDPNDYLNILLNKPHEMAMVYEGTEIGDGHEALSIIRETEAVLNKHKIELPDYHKVLFSKSSERNGWGTTFDGEFLSIIL